MKRPTTLICSVILIASSYADNYQVPSLNQIRRLNNAELQEIFSYESLRAPERPPEPTFEELSNTGRRTSIPIERPRGFESPPQQQQLYIPTNSFPSQGTQRSGDESTPYAVGARLGQLASTGAQSFVARAQQLGQAFGFDSSQLLNAGGAFFG